MADLTPSVDSSAPELRFQKKSMPTLQLFAICVLIWGSTWIAITFQLGDVAPEMSVGYRFLLASAVLFVYCRWRKLSLSFKLKQHLDFAMLGVSMFCVSYVFVYYAETYIVSGMVAVGYSASPMINMLASRVFFGTKMTARVAIAAFLGVAGIVCVFWPEFGKLSVSRNAVLGSLLTVLSVLASSAGSMVATRNQKLGYLTWSSMAWGMLYGGSLALLIGMAMGQSFTFLFSGAYVLSLVYLSLFGSIVTFGCYLTLIERIGPARTAYIGVMVPIFALVISFFFEKFAWVWLTTIGVALSVIGNIVMLRPVKNQA
ncbi:MAG: EamA family transporter [Proteobacteria bacterium]|nr:EamA family transporter [Pseudomonadota bacterium]